MPSVVTQAFFVFIVSFTFLFSMTYNFPFHWEDYRLLHLADQNNTLVDAMLTSARAYSNISDLYAIDYGYRPLTKAYDLFQAWAFGKNVLFYRAWETAIIALHAALLFAVLRKLHTPHVLALLCTALFVTYPEVWKAASYIADEAPIMHLLTFLSFILLSLTPATIFPALAGAILLRTSILFKNEGRVLLPAILLALLYGRKSVPAVIILTGAVFLTFPLLGITANTPLFQRLENTSNASLQLPTLATAYNFMQAIGVIPVILVVAGLRQALRRQETLKTLAWLATAVVIVYVITGFSLPDRHHTRINYLFMLTPFVLTLGLCAETLWTRAKTMLTILLVVAISINLFHTAQWRAGWGDYYLGWDTVVQEVERITPESTLNIPRSEHDRPAYSPKVNMQLSDASPASVAVPSERILWAYRVKPTQQEAAQYENYENLHLLAVLHTADNSPFGQL